MNNRIVCAVVGATILTSIGIFAHATDAAPVQTTSAAGMRVFLDPESGVLVDRPITQEQKNAVAADAARFRQDDSGLKLVIHPDGSKSVDLEGRYELAMRMHTSADGTVGYSCTDAAHEAQGEHSHAQPASAEPARDVR